MTDTVTIEIIDGHSKYGQAKRQYHAVCSCGWVDNWCSVVKRSAVENGDAHTREAHSRTHDGEDDGPECVYCGHSIEDHGTTQVGCADCGCGMDPDWHPDPPRGDA